MTEYQAVVNKQLPDQIRDARRRLAMLLRGAERNGMLPDILESQFNGDLIAMEKARHGAI